MYCTYISCIRRTKWSVSELDGILLYCTVHIMMGSRRVGYSGREVMGVLDINMGSKGGTSVLCESVIWI